MKGASFFVFAILAMGVRATVLETVPVNNHAQALMLATAHYSRSAQPTNRQTPHIFRVPPTGSMRPVLDSSHWVAVEACDWADLRPGLIAVFLHVRSAREAVRWGRGSTYLMHEVKEVRDGRAYASGLPSVRNPYPPTESFTPAEFVGVVRKSWRVR